MSKSGSVLVSAEEQLFPFGQGQPQIGDLNEIIGPVDRRDVDGLLLTVGPGFHQPHHPSHPLTSDPRSDTKLPLRRPHPQSSGSPRCSLLHAGRSCPSRHQAPAPGGTRFGRNTCVGILPSSRDDRHCGDFGIATTLERRYSRAADCGAASDRQRVVGLFCATGRRPVAARTVAEQRVSNA